jgi:hypothetical protein
LKLFSRATWHFRRSAGLQPAWDAIETRKLCLNKKHRKPAASRRSGFTIWRGGGVKVRSLFSRATIRLCIRRPL